MGFGAIIALGDGNARSPADLAGASPRCASSSRSTARRTSPCASRTTSPRQPAPRITPGWSSTRSSRSRSRSTSRSRCLVRGPITEHRSQITIGGPGSWFEVHGLDRRDLLDRTRAGGLDGPSIRRRAPNPRPGLRRDRGPATPRAATSDDHAEPAQHRSAVHQPASRGATTCTSGSPTRGAARLRARSRSPRPRTSRRPRRGRNERGRAALNQLTSALPARPDHACQLRVNVPAKAVPQRHRVPGQTMASAQPLPDGALNRGRRSERGRRAATRSRLGQRRGAAGSAATPASSA